MFVSSYLNIAIKILFLLFEMCFQLRIRCLECLRQIIFDRDAGLLCMPDFSDIKICSYGCNRRAHPRIRLSISDIASFAPAPAPVSRT
jgi:hypothetical protein